VTLCNSNTQPYATFTVGASGGAGGPYSYQWYQVDDLSGSNPNASITEGSGTTTSTLQMYLQGRGSPVAPNKYYYKVVVTDPHNGASATSRVATLWLADPPPYEIQYHNTYYWPQLQVQIDAPTSGCIQYTFVSDGSSNFPPPLGQVCAGDPTPQWVTVGNVDISSSYSNNIVKTTVVVSASGLTCSTSNLWYWPGP
jgi:hypothetical protein